MAKRARGHDTDDDEPTSEQSRVLGALADGHNVFVTGPAGVGKSHLIERVRASARRPERTVLTGSTGVAAVNVGGSTLHTFAGVRDGRAPTAQLVRRVLADPAACARWRRCDLLIVDEISMVDAELFDRLDAVGRAVRGRSDVPFGGIQLCLCGDFLAGGG